MSPKEAFWEGGRKSLKQILIIMAAALPFAILEPFLFLIWGSVLLLLLLFGLGPYLHWRYSRQLETFEYADAQCTQCMTEVRLTSYLNNKLDDTMTLLCPNCGQTNQALLFRVDS